MNITEDALDELIVIYKEEFGEEISRAQASEIAQRVLTLYEILSKKLPNEQRVPPSPTQHDDERPNDHPPIGFRT